MGGVPLRTFWNILAFISVVNLLALAIGAGWLWSSGRLDERRLRAVSELFHAPVQEVEDLRAEYALQEAQAAELADQERSWGQIPVTSIHAIDEADRWNDLGRSIQESLQEQANALDSGITARLDQRAALLAQWESRLRAETDRLQARIDAQHNADFKAMVGSISELKEDDALAILMGYVQEGRQDLVVMVLAAVDEDVRTDLIAEFVKADQAQLAGRLLLELRNRGTVATTNAESLDDTASSNARLATAGDAPGERLGSDPGP